MKLRTKATEKWIVIEGETPGEKAEFLIHIPTPKQINAWIKQCMETEWDKNQRFTEPNLYKFKTKKIDQIIIDWKGIEDENGIEMPCNSANKEVAFLYNTELIDKVLEKADELSTSEAKEAEEIEKN
ncbi:MAG: hypothetical protein PHO27_13150 [Sulfuricurvum sp.]|jgi:hypothetical protein|nr:hypothetical protein [Sulfuricurvum sp.]